jgi:hypothetical protein
VRPLRTSHRLTALAWPSSQLLRAFALHAPPSGRRLRPKRGASASHQRARDIKNSSSEQLRAQAPAPASSKSTRFPPESAPLDLAARAARDGRAQNPLVFSKRFASGRFGELKIAEADDAPQRQPLSRSVTPARLCQPGPTRWTRLTPCAKRGKPTPSFPATPPAYYYYRSPGPRVSFA